MSQVFGVLQAIPFVVCDNTFRIFMSIALHGVADAINSTSSGGQFKMVRDGLGGWESDKKFHDFSKYLFFQLLSVLFIVYAMII